MADVSRGSLAVRAPSQAAVLEVLAVALAMNGSTEPRSSPEVVA